MMREKNTEAADPGERKSLSHFSGSDISSAGNLIGMDKNGEPFIIAGGIK
jgi:hypothetical protein